jgi:predicted NAD-dependent protein-ADP-ribosyltransferase YbiA (DUF1768 family)
MKSLKRAQQLYRIKNFVWFYSLLMHIPAFSRWTERRHRRPIEKWGYVESYVNQRRAEREREKRVNFVKRVNSA